MMTGRNSWEFGRWLPLPLLMLAAGCGGNAEHYDTVPVSGVLTCQGKPVPNATVNFTPVKEEGRSEGRPGRVALGTTDENGRFRLTTYDNYDGAIVGRHVASVGLNYDEETGRPGSARFPCRDATLEVNVEPGMGEITLDFK